MHLDPSFSTLFHFVIQKRCTNDASPLDFTLLGISMETIKHNVIELKYLTIRVIEMCNVICDSNSMIFTYRHEITRRMEEILR